MLTVVPICAPQSRRLRGQRLDDDLVPTSDARVETGDLCPNGATTAVSPTPATLLELYPLRVPSQDAFVESTGRVPGFADLDLCEIEEFARAAHYRARVVAAQHLEVDALDAAVVTPKWLREFEKTVKFLNIYLAANRVTSDSTAHLAEIHARLVFQLTAIARQYVAAFGQSMFSQQLQSLTQQLGSWKIDRISSLQNSLEQLRELGMEEERHRNLEFYHVHRTDR